MVGIRVFGGNEKSAWDRATLIPLGQMEWKGVEILRRESRVASIKDFSYKRGDGRPLGGRKRARKNWRKKIDAFSRIKARNLSQLRKKKSIRTAQKWEIRRRQGKTVRKIEGRKKRRRRRVAGSTYASSLNHVKDFYAET